MTHPPHVLADDGSLVYLYPYRGLAGLLCWGDPRRLDERYGDPEKLAEYLVTHHDYPETDVSYNIDEGRRMVRVHAVGRDYIYVSMSTYPLLFQAMDEVFVDGGRRERQWTYSVPVGLRPTVDAAERALSKLSLDDLFEVSVGTVEDSDAVLERHGPDGEALGALLHGFCLDWEDVR